ncbi:hypothetical protein [Akkermansia massiliensis]|uniref:hypothetical protein n=1 Tax=Akkermansia massiliensis TaxID=2927224 RepID=UPI00202DB9B9|nr:hypothetical protein [Akkermansia sp. B2-R-115]MCM0684581.1 hypothetical protein [Akkermansia sp. B2-R-115]
MFIAHLPAGYLLAKTIRLRTPGRKAVMTAALLGAIAPDLDLFYFYTLDGASTTIIPTGRTILPSGSR